MYSERDQERLAAVEAAIAQLQKQVGTPEATNLEAQDKP